MIKNIRTVEYLSGSRLEFDIICDECDERAMWYERDKVVCFEHRIVFPTPWFPPHLIKKRGKSYNSFERLGHNKKTETKLVEVEYPK